MDALLITKTNDLGGKIKLKGAKNSILPILAASVLTKDDVFISNCPNLSDINDMLGIIRSIGGSVKFESGGIVVCCKDVDPFGIDRALMNKIRSSIFILGPLLARCGEAQIYAPGGCEIGKRPIDLHLNGLSELGVGVAEDKAGGLVSCYGRPKGGMLRLRYPSVGATENLMMAAALCEEPTVILGGAKEPEIVDLAHFLVSMGVMIVGAGTDVIAVKGQKELHGTAHVPISDRIVAGTYMAAVAACGGDVFLDGAVGGFMQSIIYKFRLLGMEIVEDNGGIRAVSSHRPKAIERTVTMPYPGFPTDMQPILTAVLSLADGESRITETLFESRFRYCTELKKMGASVREEGADTIVVNGKRLHGADVKAQDLRGGAALTVAALGADGITYLGGVEHIDRGYEHIERDLSGLGAKIERIKDI